MNVGIVGLGLIGGSMAKSVKARTAHAVYGADLDQETMALARMSGMSRKKAFKVSRSCMSVRLSGVRIMEAPTYKSSEEGRPTPSTARTWTRRPWPWPG